jgi:predicted RNA-binding Zn-ribbon protein involved in translation (DUF1610 family)
MLSRSSRLTVPVKGTNPISQKGHGHDENVEQASVPQQTGKSTQADEARTARMAEDNWYWLWRCDACGQGFYVMGGSFSESCPQCGESAPLDIAKSIKTVLGILVALLS